MAHTPKQITTCPHCGYRVKAKVRSLKVRPVRRCPRCGRAYTPPAVAA